ncbi:unnamed protein product, partial [Dibothriocephalus latus]
ISPGFYLDCQQAIKLYCQPPTDPGAAIRPPAQSKMEVVACLSRKLLELSLLPSTAENSTSAIPPRCMRHLRFELLSRAESIRLDPELDAACHPEWKRYCAHVESGGGEVFCSEEVESDSASAFEQGNKVLNCLTKQYIASSLKGRAPLTRPCANHIRTLLIDANLNHHVDPVLVELCYGDLRAYCSEELALAGVDGDDADGLVGECLRRQVALKRIHNASCVNEILNLNLASHADIDVDPILARDCAETIKIACAEVAPGNGRRMKCLLAAVDSPSLSEHVDAKCRRSLTLRQDLWAISAKQSTAADWRQLAAELNASTSRNLIFGVAFALVGLIFIFGLLCGRVTRRVPVNMKEK